MARRHLVPVRLERQVGLRANERRVEHHRAPVRLRRFLAAAEIAENEADQVERVRVVGAQFDRASDGAHRVLVQSAIVKRFGQQKVEHRAVGVELDRALKQSVGALESPSRLLGDAALHEGFEILRVRAKTLLEGVKLPFDDSALAVCDLEVSARDTHALVEREGAGEGNYRLVGEPLPEVKDTQVVVRASIRWIDSTGE
jgi:hypothetical protein